MIFLFYLLETEYGPWPYLALIPSSFSFVKLQINLFPTGQLSSVKIKITISFHGHNN